MRHSATPETEISMASKLEPSSKTKIFTRRDFWNSPTWYLGRLKIEIKTNIGILNNVTGNLTQIFNWIDSQIIQIMKVEGTRISGHLNEDHIENFNPVKVWIKFEKAKSDRSDNLM